MKSVKFLGVLAASVLVMGSMVGSGVSARWNGSDVSVLAARPQTYTGVLEQYFYIQAVKDWEYYAVLKAGRPPVYVDVSRVLRQAQGAVGKRVQMFGTYRTGERQGGGTTRYMVVERIVVQ